MLKRGILAIGVGAAFAAMAASRLEAGPVLDRVRAQQSVRCGAESRPGVAAPTPTGIAGLAVDLCRAAAISVLGPAGHTEFHLLDGAADFEAVRAGRFDLVFLDGSVVADHGLAADLVPGPPVFVDRFVLMVPEASRARHIGDLEGKTICFMIGSAAQRALEAAFDDLGIAFARLGFEEEVEIRDAYDVGHCQAIADRASALAPSRSGGTDKVESRVLEQPLALDPVFAMTGTQDGPWSAAVAWLLHGLVAASAPPSGWRGFRTGLDAKAARALGLRDEWQSEVTTALGTYGEMVRGNLGPGSALTLQPGPNAPWPAGLLLTPTVP